MQLEMIEGPILETLVQFVDRDGNPLCSWIVKNTDPKQEGLTCGNLPPGTFGFSFYQQIRGMVKTDTFPRGVLSLRFNQSKFHYVVCDRIVTGTYVIGYLGRENVKDFVLQSNPANGRYMLINRPSGPDFVRHDPETMIALDANHNVITEASDPPLPIKKNVYRLDADRIEIIMKNGEFTVHSDGKASDATTTIVTLDLPITIPEAEWGTMNFCSSVDGNKRKYEPEPVSIPEITVISHQDGSTGDKARTISKLILKRSMSGCTFHRNAVPILALRFDGNILVVEDLRK